MNHLFVVLPPGFETRMKILHAIDAPIKEMTVGDICEKAEISRQTFYKYFDSKFDISFWYVLFCDKLTLTEVGRTQSWHDGLLGFFTLLKREQKFFRYSVRNGYPESSERANRHRKTTLCQSIVEYRDARLTEELEFYVDTFSELLSKCVGDWFRNEMDRSPQEMTLLIENSVPRPLHSVLVIETVKQSPLQ